MVYDKAQKGFPLQSLTLINKTLIKKNIINAMH